jgi:hypothetical protein
MSMLVYGDRVRIMFVQRSRDVFGKSMEIVRCRSDFQSRLRMLRLFRYRLHVVDQRLEMTLLLIVSISNG